MRGERQAWFALLGVDRGRLLELRCFPATGEPYKRFAQSPREADAKADKEIRHRCQVFAGMLPRAGVAGDNATTYLPSRVLWADCDTDQALDALREFRPVPSAVTRSGSLTETGRAKRHPIWALDTDLDPEVTRRMVKRLAHALRADAASTDPARILRVPGSPSKDGRRRCTVEQLTGQVYPAEQVAGDLPDAPDCQPPGRRAPIVDDDVTIVAAGSRHEALVRFGGLLRSMGLCEEAIVECGRAFVRHHMRDDDPGRPLDLEHAERSLRFIARRYPPYPNRGQQS